MALEVVAATRGSLAIGHHRGKLRLAISDTKLVNDFPLVVALDMAAGVQTCSFVTEYEGSFAGSKGELAIKLVAGTAGTPVIELTWGRHTLHLHSTMSLPIAVLMRTAAAPPTDFLRKSIVRINATIMVNARRRRAFAAGARQGADATAGG